jgi:hypothetical protein
MAIIECFFFITNYEKCVKRSGRGLIYAIFGVKNGASVEFWVRNSKKMKGRGSF